MRLMVTRFLKPNPVISEWGVNGPKIFLILALNDFQRLDSHGGNWFSNADTIITLFVKKLSSPIVIAF